MPDIKIKRVLFGLTFYRYRLAYLAMSKGRHVRPFIDMGWLVRIWNPIVCAITEHDRSLSTVTEVHNEKGEFPCPCCGKYLTRLTVGMRFNDIQSGEDYPRKDV